MKNKIPALDFLRAVAIILVFLSHYELFPHPAWLETVGQFGWTGVDLFFVLSGYLIASQVFYKIVQGRFSFKEFFVKRIFRILPAYWAVVTLYFLFPWFREWGNLPPLWRFLTFTQNFGLDLRHERTFSHAWSLCIEEQYYLLFPFIAVILFHLKKPKTGIAVIASLVIIGIVARAMSWQYLVAPVIDTQFFGAIWYKWIYYPTYTRLDSLLAGISIACIFQFLPLATQYVQGNSNKILFAGLVILFMAFYICSVQQTVTATIISFPLIALAYGLVTMAAACKNNPLNKWSFSIITYIATLSYSIYLIHKAIIHLTQEYLQPYINKDSLLMFLLCIITTLTGAAILRYSIERPFLKLRERMLHKMQHAPHLKK